MDHFDRPSFLTLTTTHMDDIHDSTNLPWAHY